MKVSYDVEGLVLFTERMFHGTGTVRRWMDRVTLGFEKNAKKYAPVHTGALRAGISSSVVSVGPKMLEGRISSSAPYSLFVIRGTTGPIYANRAWNLISTNPGIPHDSVFYLRRRKGETGPRRPRRGMWLKFTGYDGRRHFAQSVSGQAANNFLLEAWNATARTHPSLRGITVPGNVVNP